MLSWVVTFLVIALIAGVLGFGGIAGTSIEIAKIIFFVAVVLFLVSARPGPGHPRASTAGWIVLFGLTAAVVGALVVAAKANHRRRAFLLGAGTGILYGVTSAITEKTGHLLNGGILHTLGSWAPYALAVVSALGLLLNQSAYQAGELRSSLPVLTVAEPIVAIIIGQALFGEHISTSAMAIVGEVAGLLCMSLGVIELGRLTTPESPAVHPRGPGAATAC